MSLQPVSCLVKGVAFCSAACSCIGVIHQVIQWSSLLASQSASQSVSGCKCRAAVQLLWTPCISPQDLTPLNQLRSCWEVRSCDFPRSLATFWSSCLTFCGHVIGCRVCVQKGKMYFKKSQFWTRKCSRCICGMRSHPFLQVELC